MLNDNQEKTKSEPNKVARSFYLIIIFIFISITLSIIWKISNKKNNIVCQTNQNLETLDISAKDKIVKAEVVEQLADKIKGLSGRNCLTNGHGMLFVYDEPAIDRCFWMKDMHFNIDMIWLDKDKRIVKIKENATPDSYPNTFCPEIEAKYVLEINSGQAKELDWGENQELSF